MPHLALLALLACDAPPAHLSRPNRVALGPDGEVYVSDFQHDRIVVFDAAGRFRATFGRQGLGPDELWRVMALAVADDGSLVVANRRPESADHGAATRNELKRFRGGREVAVTPLDGRVIERDGGLDALAPGSGGTWLLADATRGALIQVDAAGNDVGRFGGVLPVDLAPSALARDGDAYWVLEQRRHRLSRIGPGGTQAALTWDDEGHGPPRFPSAVALCPGAWLAVADLGNHRIQRYDLRGRWLGEFEPVPAHPDAPVQLLDLAVSPDCARLYLVDSKGDRVLVTDPDGAVLQTLSAW